MTLRAWGTKGGFSLLELLVVLVLVSLGSTVALPSFARWLKKSEFRQSVLELAATARSLRRRAIQENSLQQLVLDARENVYLAAGAKRVSLPSHARIAEVEGGQPLAEGVYRFVFFPNGSALGGKVELSGGEGDGYVVWVEPLSGRVAVGRSRG